MKSTIFCAALVLSTSAYAEPIVDPLRTHLIAGWMKYCTGNLRHPRQQEVMDTQGDLRLLQLRLRHHGRPDHTGDVRRPPEKRRIRQGMVDRCVRRSGCTAPTST